MAKLDECMATGAYRIVKIPGLRDSPRRAVAYLECEGDDEIDAGAILGTLDHGGNTKRRQLLLARFEYWIGHNRCDKYFHGWPNEPGHKNCIVFRWNEGREMQRLYGFTCHPRKTDPSFQLCVLVSHRQKNERLTDPKEKSRAERLRIDRAVVAALEMFYSDSNEGNRWRN